jgi:type II secretory pathway pseudopilin PulG
MSRHALAHACGFTLVEALVATAVLACTAVALAHLVAVGRRQTTHARDSLHAVTVAQSKLEELRAATWSATVPGSDLPISTADALIIDTPGFFDRAGPYVRRWTVTRRDPGDPEVVVINVCAFPAQDVTARPEACVATLRARRP